MGNESASYSLTGRGPYLSPPSLEDVACFLEAVADVSNGIPDGVIVGKPLAAVAGIIHAGSREARVAATAAEGAEAELKSLRQSTQVGEKVKTPDNAPERFTRLKGGQGFADKKRIRLCSGAT